MEPEKHVFHLSMQLDGEGRGIWEKLLEKNLGGGGWKLEANVGEKSLPQPREKKQRSYCMTITCKKIRN